MTRQFYETASLAVLLRKPAFCRWHCIEKDQLGWFQSRSCCKCHTNCNTYICQYFSFLECAFPHFWGEITMSLFARKTLRNRKKGNSDHPQTTKSVDFDITFLEIHYYMVWDRVKRIKCAIKTLRNTLSSKFPNRQNNSKSPCATPVANSNCVSAFWTKLYLGRQNPFMLTFYLPLWYI